MMQKKYIGYFIGANISILLSTAALMCIPICAINAMGREKLFSICVGLIFWSGLSVTCILDWRCRAMLKKLRKKNRSARGLGRPDILRFAQNKYMRVIDTGLGMAALFFIFILMLNVQNDWLVMTDISMLFMTFSLHCLYSGKIKK